MSDRPTWLNDTEAARAKRQAGYDANREANAELIARAKAEREAVSDAPKRIQRRRAKGWRLPDGAVIVDRTTKWGNPFVVGEDGTAAECVKLYVHLLAGLVCLSCKAPVERQQVARRYVCDHIHELRGKDLACWCAPGKPCHADILLKAANRD